MKRPLFPLALSLMAGITIGTLDRFPDQALIVALLASLLVLLLSWVRNWRRTSALMACLALFLLGVLNVSLDLHEAPGPHDISRYPTSERMSLEGLLVENPRIFPNRTELTVEATKIIEGSRVIPVEGRILLTLTEGDRLPVYGDLIRFKARLREPRSFQNPGSFDYRRYLRIKGIRLRGTLDKSGFVVLRTNNGNPFRTRLEHFRDAIRKMIRQHAPSPQGEIIQAMILGEQSEIPREIMDMFSRTGTTHIIAISGFNIGIIAAFTFFLVHALMKSSAYLLLRFNIQRVSTLVTFVPVILYAFIGGFGISIIRATLMIIAFLIALFIGRDRDLLNTLALAALVILSFSPLSLFDVSFQLSFVAVASILLIVPRLASLLPPPGNAPEAAHPRLRKAFHGFLLFLAASLAATLGAAPLIAYYFNLLSLITLLANVLIVPLMGYLVILIGMALIVTTPVSHLLSVALVKVSSWLIGLSLLLVDFFSSLPHAYTFVTTPTLIELAAYYLLLATAVAALDLWSERRGPNPRQAPGRKEAFVAVSLALLFIFLTLDGLYLNGKNRHPGRLRTTFIDVGQGSSTLVDFPGGLKMIVDGGGFHHGHFDTGRYVLAPFLWHERISRADIVVLSHPHPDHLNGLVYILNHFDVREVWSTGDEGDSDFWDRFKTTIAEKGLKHRIMRRGSRPVDIGGARVEILSPAGRGAESDGDNLNDRSLVLRITYGAVSYLLPGDISEETESRLIKDGLRLKSTVLLVPHHGARGSSSSAFLRKVQPAIAVISCGAGNIFRLPHPDVLERYGRRNVQIFRTDIHGAVTIETDGKTVTPRTFRSEGEPSF